MKTTRRPCSFSVSLTVGRDGRTVEMDRSLLAVVDPLIDGNIVRRTGSGGLELVTGVQPFTTIRVRGVC